MQNERIHELQCTSSDMVISRLYQVYTRSYQWQVDKGCQQWWQHGRLDSMSCDLATDPYNCCRKHDDCCRPLAASPAVVQLHSMSFCMTLQDLNMICNNKTNVKNLKHVVSKLLKELLLCWCHCHSLSLAPVNPDWFFLLRFTFLVPAHTGSPGQNPRQQ